MQALEAPEGLEVGDLGVLEIEPLQAREALEGLEVGDLGALEIEPLQAREALEGIEVGDLGSEGKVDAFVSAGNTGAIMAGSLLKLRRIPAQGFRPACPARPRC